jgi:hypothetical protein
MFFKPKKVFLYFIYSRVVSSHGPIVSRPALTSQVKKIPGFQGLNDEKGKRKVDELLYQAFINFNPELFAISKPNIKNFVLNANTMGFENFSHYLEIFIKFIFGIVSIVQLNIKFITLLIFWDGRLAIHTKQKIHCLKFHRGS